MAKVFTEGQTQELYHALNVLDQAGVLTEHQYDDLLQAVDYAVDKSDQERDRGD